MKTKDFLNIFPSPTKCFWTPYNNFSAAFFKHPVYYTGCLKIREFRIQSVVGKDPVELEKYLEKKIRSSWRRKRTWKSAPSDQCIFVGGVPIFF
jgi:hypothetical protein